MNAVHNNYITVREMYVYVKMDFIPLNGRKQLEGRHCKEVSKVLSRGHENAYDYCILFCSVCTYGVVLKSATYLY